MNMFTNFTMPNQGNNNQMFFMNGISMFQNMMNMQSQMFQMFADMMKMQMPHNNQQCSFNMPFMNMMPNMGQMMNKMPFANMMPDMSQMMSNMPFMNMMPDMSQMMNNMPFMNMMQGMNSNNTQSQENAENNNDASFTDMMTQMNNMTKQMTDMMKNQMEQMKNVDKEIRESLKGNAKQMFGSFMPHKKDGNSQMPFGISPEMLQSFLQIEMTPDKLNHLQRILDTVFDRYLKATGSIKPEEPEVENNTEDLGKDGFKEVV